MYLWIPTQFRLRILTDAIVLASVLLRYHAINFGYNHLSPMTTGSFIYPEASALWISVRFGGATLQPL